MTDATPAPEGKLSQNDNWLRATSPGPNTSGACIDNPAWGVQRAGLWPFKASDTSPLAWWRTLPSHAIRAAEHLRLLTTLDQIDVVHGGADFATALNGDPAAAIDVVFSLMPIEQMTLKTDIAMTALLRCALERNASAALVLAQVIGLTDGGHPYATEFAASWLAYGQHYSANPSKFSEAGRILLAAFGNVTAMETKHER